MSCGTCPTSSTSIDPQRMATLVRRFTDDLATLKPAVSLHEAPIDWLAANATQIWEAVDKLPGVDRDKFAEFPKLVYPRFVAYTVVRLRFYNGDPSILVSLEEKQLEWITSDAITQLAAYQFIQGILWYFLSKCTDYSVIVRKEAEKIVQLDILCIVARLLSIFSDGQRVKGFVKEKQRDVQVILDLLQALLDFPHVGPARPSILRVTCLLTKKSGLYPTSLDLHGVERKSEYAVDGGSFGDIWQGVVGSDSVAIKVMRNLNPDLLDENAKAFTREAVLWRQFHHPNVLPFYGVSLWPQDPRIVGLISPWMKNGNLAEYLGKAPRANRPRLLLDIALGLEYLHTSDPPVIHGDLKGTNILITPSGRACVADFGLCSLLPDPAYICNPTSSATKAGAWRYRAPELLNLGENDQWDITHKSPASDVYSFGCVCYEVFTGKARFAELPMYPAITAIIRNYRLIQPTSVDNMLWDLVERCWNVEPKSRPIISDIVKSLQLQLGNIQRSEGCACEWDQGIMSRLRSPVLISPLLESPTLLQGDQTLSLTSRDTIIALMGPTGTGKSSFVNAAMRHTIAVVGENLASCTQEVRAFGCLHPDRSGRKVVLVDTPGFDDTERSDYAILKVIAAWLEQTYNKQVTLTGVLQFHSIDRRRMRGTPHRNIEMFRRLCGADALRNVILVTTCWDEVSEEVGSTREAQLKSEFWKRMVSQGCRVVRFQPPTYESAWGLIDQFDATASRPLKMQKELAGGKKLHQTSAYMFLFEWWERFMKKLKQAGRRKPSKLMEKEKE